MRQINMFVFVILCSSLIFAAEELVPNGHFEEGFHFDSRVNGTVGNSWNGYNLVGNPAFEQSNECMPGGQYSQRIWSNWVPFQSGVSQKISAVPGKTYRLACWITTQTKAGSPLFRNIGMGTTGSLNPESADAVWGPGLWRDKTFTKVTVEATAKADLVTVFTMIDCPFGYENAESWTDVVTIEDLGGSAYTPTPTPSPVYTNTPDIPCKFGDPNCDNAVTPGDALLAFQIYLAQYVITGNEPCNILCAADTNSSGSVTPGDALCIFQTYLGQTCN